MKKILLSIVAVVTLTASSVFGNYTDENFIDFLVHGNQLRIRLDRLGFIAGTDNIRVALALTGATGDVILENLQTGSKNQGINKFLPAALAAVGYKTEMFGVGLGYQFKWINSSYQVHTPVLTATAMNNAFRINVPVRIGIGSGDSKGQLGLSIHPQIRYYTGMQAFSHFRLYVNYGEYTYNASDIGKLDKNNYQKVSSVGVQLRLYFGAMVGDILVEPILRVQYDQALKTTGKTGGNNDPKSPGYNFGVTAINRGAVFKDSDLGGGYIADLERISGLGYIIEDPYRFGVAVPVGFTANSDIVSLYLEPALSFTMISGKKMGSYNDEGTIVITRKDPFYTFGYVVYGEIYIRPLPALEWYFEAQTGGATVANGLAKTSDTSLVFNTSTGITWYF